MSENPDEGVPPGVDPETGEVLDPLALEKYVSKDKPPPPTLAGEVVGESLPKLDNLEEIHAAIVREMVLIEKVGSRLGRARQELDGYLTRDGEYVMGVRFELANHYDSFTRKLYARCNDFSKKKDERPRWPGEDVRLALAHGEMDGDPYLRELRIKQAALETEVKSLEEYAKLKLARLNGLQSLFAHKRAQAEQEARYGQQGRG